MKRIHLKYTIPADVITATQTFMAAKPWRRENDFTALAQDWANMVVTSYELGAITVMPAFFEGGGVLPGEAPEIRMERSSMILLFGRMGMYLALNGKLEDSLDNETEARAWGYSVFYRSNPAMFRARVREGRIHLDPYLLFTSQTEQALRDYDIDPTDPRATTLLQEAQLAAIADAAPENEPVSETPESTGSAAQAFADADSTIAELRAMNTRQLRVYATGRGLTGTWSMNKPTLLRALGVPVPEASEVR